jgi:hypothetical protein
VFGFRALDEHKQLDVSQFSISVDTNGNKELHYSLNRVIQQVTLPEWFVIFLFSKGMPAA